MCFWKGLICAIVWATCTTVYSAVLTVHITNIQSDKGYINLAVYPSAVADDFPYSNNMQFADPTATTKPAKVGTVTITVEIPDGIYALASYQDENNNGKMDLFFGIPKEAYGFSNDAKGVLLPPSFNKASFMVNGDTTVTFTLNK